MPPGYVSRQLRDRRGGRDADPARPHPVPHDTLLCCLAHPLARLIAELCHAFSAAVCPARTPTPPLQLAGSHCQEDQEDCYPPWSESPRFWVSIDPVSGKFCGILRAVLVIFGGLRGVQAGFREQL